jgi:hypothetical protein
MALCLPRGDFALPTELCEDMRARAATLSERNYWTAALLLARERDREVDADEGHG